MLETLQRTLREPSPPLLDPAVGASVLVSTVGDPSGGREGDPADAPVGYLLWLPGETVYVAECVVAPAFRREGRARRLFAELFASLPAGTPVSLQVAAANGPARSLYRSLGFEVVDRDPDAYESVPGLWMATVVA